MDQVKNQVVFEKQKVSLEIIVFIFISVFEFICICLLKSFRFVKLLEEMKQSFFGFIFKKEKCVINWRQRN